MSAIQIGVTQRMRMNRAVSAGRVVAEVGLVCVDRKSVMARNGPRRMLHLAVNSLSVSTISSRLLLCRADSPSMPLPLCFAAVDDNGEYRREYMPTTSATTTNMGPA